MGGPGGTEILTAGVGRRGRRTTREVAEEGERRGTEGVHGGREEGVIRGRTEMEEEEEHGGGEKRERAVSLTGTAEGGDQETVGRGTETEEEGEEEAGEIGNATESEAQTEAGIEVCKIETYSSSN